MKMTLLQIVQDILNDMDSDEVNSIDDTTESVQVAQIVKSTFFALISNRNWPHLRRSISLDSSTELSKPTHMTLGENVKELSFINYNKIGVGETRKRYAPVSWAEPDDFLRHTNQRNSDEANIVVVSDYTGVELLIRNDQAPTYYTSFDDTHVVFDSYDVGVDDILQESKVQAQGYVAPSWSHTDGAIPDLPEEAFTLLLEEAKSRCSMKLRQMADQKAEQEAGRQNRWLSRKAWRVQGGIKYPNYGRGSSKPRDPTFTQGR
jgi:hypothetical protein